MPPSANNIIYATPDTTSPVRINAGARKMPASGTRGGRARVLCVPIIQHVPDFFQFKIHIVQVQGGMSVDGMSQYVCAPFYTNTRKNNNNNTARCCNFRSMPVKHTHTHTHQVVVGWWRWLALWLDKFAPPTGNACQPTARTGPRKQYYFALAPRILESIYCKQTKL